MGNTNGPNRILLFGSDEERYVWRKENKHGMRILSQAKVNIIQLHFINITYFTMDVVTKQLY